MIESDSNGPTIPYGFGNRDPIVPHSPIDLNLPPNPFNVLTTMAINQADLTQRDEDYSPQLPEPSDKSPLSTPPMNLSSIEDWETPHTAMDNTRFYSADEPQRVYWDIFPSDTFDSNEPRSESFTSNPSSTPLPPRTKEKVELGDVFSSKKGGVSQHNCEACG